MNALHTAVRYQCYEIIKILLRHGENINRYCFGQRTVLHCAAKRNYTSMAEFLIQQQRANL
ncbi:hypothetical protein TVAG_467420 [Trichomonas vaginalis G3]|uniref:Uncharacterized protein n=1 Tax=Trichomonas vaginalis (strain ATCC PRA-98 / G3) TaxID=412133 RepID=A2GAR9_TRIV3|nr:Ankyrin repeat family [Trichomonas vaginalis G3]EAX85746.1 hypothetical protein TVAG_467420 [Trichomonas vaginalis G3]KAI5486451.1 Ankyrin repeat family [Trichomonas vaginalis G3]|eukprot:XP_001298676.1 hypothetical protein [Trichomonas vaginalis G3]